MKKSFTSILLGAFLAFFACSEDEAPEQQVVGNWELIESIGSWPVDSSSDTELDFTTNYQFNFDGTFTKTRTTDDVEEEATGNYTVVSNTDGTYIDLTFESGLEIIESCHSETEVFVLKSKNRLEGTWGTCDGMKFIFSKR
ncbi:hypothetical protein ACFSKL_06380 [Belliella marina]|uniref:Lipocalin-like domain-containing protein n=1 Tax=Belliella marina TaxID=1644146 RepID=A0ABW4VJX7_9BACT